MHECALETHEHTCVYRAAKPFFISVIHSPPGVVRHVAAPELPSQEGKAPRRGTRGSTGAPLLRKAEPGAIGHVVAPELTSSRRQGPELRDT
jgi:hypothetical protein